MRLRFAALGLMLAGCAVQEPVMTDRDGFDAFYATFRAQVSEQGLDADMLDAAFGGDITPYPAALHHEQNQPETQKTFVEYMKSMLSETRRTKGAALYQEHLATLKDIEARTGVPAEVLIAAWGVESNFGANQGNHPVIPALVTLAWQSPRSAFFSKEAMDALRVVAQQRMEPQELTGSWAGAMGQCQFMPSNFLKYAVDGDGDGRADIWGTPADVFASSANFLKELGWKTGTPWRLKAHVSSPLPETVKLNDRGLSERHTIAQWQTWGVIPTGGLGFGQFGDVTTKVRLYRPLGERGPTYMLGSNYDVILDWNRSSYFATSLLLLAESVKKGGGLPDV